jgi:hypothetical protein
VRVTIAGAAFTDDTTFRIGPEPCTDVDVQNEGAALCNASPALPAGVYDVIAQTGAATFLFASGFTVSAAGGCACASSSRASDVALSALLLASLALWTPCRRMRRCRRRRRHR